MAKEKEIKWPPPPERDVLHQQLDQEAGRLRAEYLKTGKGGSGMGEKRWALRAAALDLLRTTDAPSSLVMLFHVMLGDVAGASPKSKFPWLDVTLDYEARAHNKGREVDNAEIVDKAILPTHATDRDHAMRQVRKVRKAEWYPMLRDARRIYLMDNPETV